MPTTDRHSVTLRINFMHSSVQNTYTHPLQPCPRSQQCTDEQVLVLPLFETSNIAWSETDNELSCTHRVVEVALSCPKRVIWHPVLSFASI
jgi:hypothetical protein